MLAHAGDAERRRLLPEGEDDDVVRDLEARARVRFFLFAAFPSSSSSFFFPSILDGRQRRGGAPGHLALEVDLVCLGLEVRDGRVGHADGLQHRAELWCFFRVFLVFVFLLLKVG